MAWTYACRDFPGMGDCPGVFSTESTDELWRHLELHGELAHGEDPKEWSDAERQQIRDLIHEQ